MKLTEWLKKKFTRIVVLNEPIEKTNDKGMIIRVQPDQTCRELTMGLLSTNNKEEWKKVAIHLAPIGIVIDEIPDEYYNEKIILLRNELTKLLFDAKNSRVVENYLKILSLRDREHWAEQKNTTKIEAKSNDLNITFEVV